MENGVVSVETSWQTITFAETFVDPVVVAKPATDTDTDPVVVRIRNVSATGFDIQLQEWNYQDGNHATESVSYLVVERGSWTLADNSRLVATSFNTSAAADFINVSYPTSFNVTPIVVSSVATYNDASAVTTRTRDVTTTGFRSRLQEEEAADKVHGTETIAYIAWEPGNGTVGSLTYEVGSTGNVVDEEYHELTLNNGSTVQIRICEENSVYDEMRHATEEIGYIAFDTPAVFVADMQTFDGFDPSNVRVLIAANPGPLFAPNAYFESAPVLVYPNPLREHDAPIRFRVLGDGIARIQVSLYDLSGRLRFDSGWVVGDTLEWMGIDDEGILLANGVYIFRVSAKGNAEQFVAAELGKLFILR